MSIAYVDTSALVAIAFEEPGGSQAGERLEGFSRLLSSNLLEAELRAAFARERQKFDAEVSPASSGSCQIGPWLSNWRERWRRATCGVRICGTSPRRSTSRQEQRRLVLLPSTVRNGKSLQHSGFRSGPAGRLPIPASRATAKLVPVVVLQSRRLEQRIDAVADALTATPYRTAATCTPWRSA